MRRSVLPAIVVVLVAAAAVRADPFIPNDRYYAPYEWYAARLNLPQAWSRSLGSTDVVVAVLDTGVMADTPDLAGRLLAPLSSTGSPPLDGTTHHHGTWVASVVGMGVNNDDDPEHVNLGGAGVGNFSLLPITVTDAQGHNISGRIADGIRLAADEGARVIIISHSTLTYGVLDTAAAYARGLGALTFVAAGNSNREEFLTDYASLIFVSGTNRDDGRWDEGAEGSSWGAFVDLAAPADDILIADPHDPNLPAGYGIHNGTSFAAPLAGGAAALAWSINPALTADEVLAMLYDTAVDLGDPGRDAVYGRGRIDIGAVAEAAYATLPEPATLALVLAGLCGILGARRHKGR